MIHLRLSSALAFVLAIAPVVSAQTAGSHHLSPAKLDVNSRQTFELAMGSMEGFWDPSEHLLRAPAVRGEHPAANRYMVRETGWYAFGLLMRDAPGDRQRAVDGLEAILKEQFPGDGKAWHGTFRRSPEEPTPSDAAAMWRTYDPNWREFIGTTFAMILIEFPDRIPADLAARMYESIDRAIEGEMQQRRLLPSYSNIALMYGALWDFAAAHNHNEDWKRRSAKWIEDVAALFHEHNSFFEYNSPTYYGVDLFGLALWRSYGTTPRIRQLGSQIEGVLWSDIAAFYHPGLRNIAGPYDRSYGMDMESYVALTGVWMRMLLPEDKAPLPKIDAHTDHLSDLWFAPLFTVLGAHPPAAALREIRSFPGERAVRRVITNERTATAWIGDKAIYGGQITGLTKDAPPDTQFHPATVQWRTPSGGIGWFYVSQAPKIDAEASKSGIRITADGTLILRIHTAGSGLSQVTANKWLLPGLTVTIDADQQRFSIAQSTLYETNDTLNLTYSNLHHMTLAITPQ